MQCLFCYSDRIRKAAYPRPTRFNDKTFGYMECRDCGLIFIDPLPGPDDYNRMYEKSYHDEFYFKEAPDYSGWLQLFERFSQEKSVVDYGCGDGAFLKFFHQNGYQCTGVEYDPVLVSRLRQTHPGITFYTVDEFRNLQQPAGFNAIFMGDVLEHIDRPADFLNKLMDKIKPGGLIAAQGPLENNRNLALSFRKFTSRVKSAISKDSLAAHVPYHISFSNAGNQEKLFQQAGLSTLYYKIIETRGHFPVHFSSSVPGNMKHLLARASISLSGVLPGNMGNRFLYVGVKK